MRWHQWALIGFFSLVEPFSYCLLQLLLCVSDVHERYLALEMGYVSLGVEFFALPSTLFPAALVFDS